MAAAYSRAGGTVTASGWTPLANVGSSRTVLFGRVSDGGGEDTGVFVSSIETPIAAQIARFSGGPATLTGIVHASQTQFNSAEVDLDTPALTVTEDGCLKIWVGSKEDNFGPTVTPPGGSTLIGESNYDSTSDLWMPWSYLIDTTAANISASTFDSASASTADSRSIVIALLPGSGGAGGSLLLLKNPLALGA